MDLSTLSLAELSALSRSSMTNLDVMASTFGVASLTEEDFFALTDTELFYMGIVDNSNAPPQPIHVGVVGAPDVATGEAPVVRQHIVSVISIFHPFGDNTVTRLNASASTGARIRLRPQTCDGTDFNPDTAGPVTYTVYRVKNTIFSAVEGHTSVSVPASAWCDSVQTDAETNQQYTFDYTISAVPNPPFPVRGGTYRVEFLFFDATGEPSVHKIDVRAN